MVFTSTINVMPFDRITFNPNVMGGKPCIRGIRITAGTILGLLAAKRTQEEILELYPLLEQDDIWAVLESAAWRITERELPLSR